MKYLVLEGTSVVAGGGKLSGSVYVENIIHDKGVLKPGEWESYMWIRDVRPWMLGR